VCREPGSIGFLPQKFAMVSPMNDCAQRKLGQRACFDFQFFNEANDWWTKSILFRLKVTRVPTRADLIGFSAPLIEHHAKYIFVRGGGAIL
jgi:hypothetical protein